MTKAIEIVATGVGILAGLGIPMFFLGCFIGKCMHFGLGDYEEQCAEPQELMTTRLR